MNLPFGERATAELVGKLRLLTSCELCKRPCSETFFAVACGHYLCKNCVRQQKLGCAKCNAPSQILRAHYLDPISETLLRLKELFCADRVVEPPTNKRKAADDDCFTPTSKISRNESTHSSQATTSPNVDVVFAKKSRPDVAGAPLSAVSTPTTGGRSLELRAIITPTIARTAQDLLTGKVNPSKPTKDSPVIRSHTDESQTCCQCGKRNAASPGRKTTDSGVQASNSVLALDVAVLAKTSTMETEAQTRESMSNSSRPVMVSTEVQTERPYISVKRYFEVAVQTYDQFNDTSVTRCLEHGSEHQLKSLTSTQSGGGGADGGGNHTVHAQPISLDMSPIKKMERSADLSGKKCSINSTKKVTEDTIDFSGDEMLRDEPVSISSKANDTLRSSNMKDTLDSLDYKTLDLKQAREQPKDSCAVNFSQRSPEPDSLDSLPSEIFNELEKEKKKSPPKKSRSQPEQRDTLESFFKSSEEASVPETEPQRILASPVKAVKSKRATPKTEVDSPLKLVEKKRTIIVSDDDEEPSGKAGVNGSRNGNNDNRNRPLKTKDKLGTQVKGIKTSAKSSQVKLTKALPTFSSDEDDMDPLPMDTEDMRNLEKEIENLDREMEDSKNGGSKGRFG